MTAPGWLDGTWEHGIVKAAVLAEECGEVARAVLDHSSTDTLRAELVQVAAVCVAWIEALRETAS